MNGNIKVFIADDHQVVREGIKLLIQENPNFIISGEANNGKDLLLLLETLDIKPDVILMDIHMPVIDGVIATEKVISQYQGNIKVLALTMIKQGSYIRKMLQAGCSGYILKNCDKYELFQAIDTIAKGGTHFSKAVSNEVMNEMIQIKKTEKSLPAINLTNRELDVLKLIVNDQSNKEIAGKLDISIRTVETHKQNLIQKTGSKNIAGLVVYAIKHHLVEI